MYISKKRQSLVYIATVMLMQDLKSPHELQELSSLFVWPQ